MKRQISVRGVKLTMMTLADFDFKIPKTHFENGGFSGISDKKQWFWKIW
jgi:hypothetical protein